MPRNGTKNLKPLNQRTKEEQRKIAIQGGIASGKARQEKRDRLKTMREYAQIMCEHGISVMLPNGDKEETTLLGAIVLAQIKKAAQEGDTRSAQFIADLLGENQKNINIKSDGFSIIVNDEKFAKQIDDALD